MNFLASMTPTVKSLLIVNGVMFLLQFTLGTAVIANLGLWPLDLSELSSVRPHFQLPQLVTYGFLHGDIAHLLLNMYALWMFGSTLERLWGAKIFVVYYFACLIGAGIVQLIVATQGDGYYPTIGASGAVFGLLLAFGMFFPRAKLFLIFIPIPIEARYFVIFYGLIELWFGVTGTLAGIAHFAHLGGMLVGLLLILYWRKYPPRF